MLFWLRFGALAAALAPRQAPPATPLRRGFEVVATFDTSTLDGATRAPLALQVKVRHGAQAHDAAVELGRLRAIPLPPRAGEEPRV